MQKITADFFVKHLWIILLITLVLSCAFFWRFINYSERWTISQDQARDAIIGLYAVENHLLPLVGPPSSAGAFSFGPFYYWLIILFTVIIPTVNGPWIGFTFLSVITPLLFFWIGFQYGGKISGFIFGMVAAFSSEFIFHSTDMLNPIPISFLVTLAFLFLIKLIDQKKIMFALWLGLTIGLTINFHLQALGLLVIIPLTSVLNHFKIRQKVYVFLLALAGFFISFVPLLFFNFTHQNILLQNIFTFLFGNQVSSGVENNLVNDILVFWPQLWGITIAHLPLLGYGLIVLLLFAIVFSLGDTKTLRNSFYIISTTLLFQIFFLFVYQGVRSPIYLIVFHAFFVFLTGWIVLNFYQFHKYAGIGLLIILLGFTLSANWAIIQNNHSQVSEVMRIKEQIPGSGMTTGSVKVLSDDNSAMISLPLYYLFLKEHRISLSGREIVVCENKLVKDTDGISEKWSCPMDVPPIVEKDHYKIYDKSSLKSEQQQFVEVQKDIIYYWLFSNYQ